MSASRSNANSQQISELYRSCTRILGFLAENGRLAHPKQFSEALDEARDRRSVRALRSALADLTQRARALPIAQQKELEIRLATADHDSSEGTLGDPVRTVLQRGTIETEDEYRAVLSRVEDIFEDPAYEAEVDRLNAMLGRAHDQRLR